MPPDCHLNIYITQTEAELFLQRDICLVFVLSLTSRHKGLIFICIGKKTALLYYAVCAKKSISKPNIGFRDRFFISWKAREFGDLSENAEYHATKERQAFLEKKIAELHEKLTNSEIIDESQIPKDKAYLGATVKLQDKKNGREMQYTLVTVEEADFDQKKISTASPIGKALLGKRVGEVVDVQVPVGILTYEILDISRD